MPLVHTMLNQTGGEYLAVPNSRSTNFISVASEDGSDFDFAGGWVGARLGTTEERIGSWEPTYLTVSGYRDGVLVGSETTVATVDDPAAFIALDLQDINLLVFDSSSDLGQVVIDDLYMARIPDVADELYYETDANAVLHSADLMPVFEEATSVLDNDGDPDGGSLTVSAVEGSAVGVGAAVTLASGALVTMNADGTFEYDPNGAFDDLGFGEYAEDSFEYTVSGSRGGTATATATVTVGGVGAFDTALAVIDFEDVTTNPAAPFTTHAGFAWSGEQIGAVTVDFLEATPGWDGLAHTMLNQTGGEYLAAAADAVSVTSADGSDFDFTGGWFGALKATDEHGEISGSELPSYFTVSGYRDGVLVGAETAVLTSAGPVAFIALDLQDIDLLTFESDGIGDIVFDDLYMMT